MNSPIKYLVFLIIFLLSTSRGQNSWYSQIVYPDLNNKLHYIRDQDGNMVPDFSYAGYRNSEVPLPDVPVKRTLSPVSGDNTVQIQNALFEISMMPKDSSGFRGALLLEAGVYEIRGTIRIQVDGIVIRGAGDGADTSSNTILWATGNSPHQRSVIVAGGGSETRWREAVSGSYRDITSDTILVGERAFTVTDASVYSVGDNVIIYHPCTEDWLAGVDSGGTYWQLPGAEPGVDLPWAVGSQPLVFNRYVREISGNQIIVDVPFYNHLIRGLSQSQIYKYARTGIRTHIGIENIRIDIQTAGLNDDYHAWNAIDLFQIEDAWIRNCTMLHFGLSAVRTNTATQITVENCQGLDPHSELEGGNRYNFQVYNASQQILFKNCHTTNGRHHYVSNGTSWTSGIVFLDCTSSGAFTSSEGHRRWTMGMLYDNLVELDGPRPGYNPRLLGLYNRGYYGTSHGWSSAHSVAWNCDVAGGDLIVQKPPTSQNYAIGCSGTQVTGQSPPAPFPDPEGYIEGTNQSGLVPRSLFMAQLNERLGIVALDEPGNLNNSLNQSFRLEQNYPNPFNASTHITYQLFTPADVELKVYNLLGELISSPLRRQHQLPGTYLISWSGIDQQGSSVSSGIYIYTLVVRYGNRMEIFSRKLIFLK